MENKLKIIKLGFKIYISAYLLILILTIFDSKFLPIILTMISLYGLLMIIFRKEAVIMWRDHQNRFKGKHPILGKFYNPWISELHIIISGVGFLIFPLIALWIKK